MGMRLSFALLIILLVAAGCARRDEEAPAPAGRRVSVVFESSPRDAFAQDVFAALEALARKRGGRILDEDFGSAGAASESAASGGLPKRAPVGLELRCLCSKLEGRDDAQILGVLADDGPDLVLAVGPRFAASAEALASRYPKVRFAVLGAEADDRTISTNVIYLHFDDAAAAFLAGAAGAFAAFGRGAGTKAKLGFLGALDSREANRLELAFRAGAATALPALSRPGSVIAAYCGRSLMPEPKAVDAWRARLAAKGAEVALETGFSPEARLLRGGELLASTARSGGAAAAAIVEELFEKGSLASGSRVLGLADGAVGLAIRVEGAQEKERLEAAIAPLRERLASGSIRPPRDEGELNEYYSSLPML
jgi:basic membrane lipoprotein Med (substrate-binding protein (PBP1-ABC) superfamily)